MMLKLPLINTFLIAVLVALTWSAPVAGQDSPATQPPTEIENSDSIDDIKPPEIIRDLSQLPFPAKRMWELLMEAALSGDIKNLRPFIGSGNDMTMLSLGELEGDPIEFLKTQSGDTEGHETLAILANILEAGFVRMDADSDHELYVWPYFYAWPLEGLTREQRVELFRIVTYGDFQDMTDFGAYIFYRVGITPAGRWQFFVSGD